MKSFPIKLIFHEFSMILCCEKLLECLKMVRRGIDIYILLGTFFEIQADILMRQIQKDE